MQQSKITSRKHFYFKLQVHGARKS